MVIVSVMPVVHDAQVQLNGACTKHHQTGVARTDDELEGAHSKGECATHLSQKAETLISAVMEALAEYGYFERTQNLQLSTQAEHYCYSMSGYLWYAKQTIARMKIANLAHRVLM